MLEEKGFQFVVRQGPQLDRVFPLHSVVVIIGREPSADVTLNDPEVSRLHARLTATGSGGSGYEIEDLGSTNGTFVDGRQIGREAVMLSPGQLVKLGGSVVLAYETVPIGDKADLTLLDDVATAVEPGQMVKTAVSPPDLPPITTADASQPPVTDPMLPPTFDGELATPLDDDIPALRQLAETADQLDELEPKLAALPHSLAEPVHRQPPPPRVVPAREPISPPPPSGGNTTRRVINILLILLVLLTCCCCGFLVFMYQWGGDWLLRQMQLIP